MSSACILRSGERFTTLGPGVLSQYCFSYGAHYDPGNTRFGALLAVNDETLAPGAGFALHPHAGIDVITWVVSGRVLHTGAGSPSRTTGRGDVQVLQAGSGTRHGQFSADDAPCRYVQFWVQGDDTTPPADRVLTIDLVGVQGQLTRVLQLEHSGAILYAAMPEAGTSVALPVAALLHLYVVAGRVDVEGLGCLVEGDSARLWHARSPLVSAAEEQVGKQAEVLVWALPA